jgi:hypothetical protein
VLFKRVTSLSPDDHESKSRKREELKEEKFMRVTEEDERILYFSLQK